MRKGDDWFHFFPFPAPPKQFPHDWVTCVSEYLHSRVAEYSSYGLWILKLCLKCPSPFHPSTTHILIGFGAPRTSVFQTTKPNPSLWTIVAPTRLLAHQESHEVLQNLTHICTQSWGCMRTNQKKRPPKLWFPRSPNNQLTQVQMRSCVYITNPWKIHTQMWTVVPLSKTRGRSAFIFHFTFFSSAYIFWWVC